MIFGFILGQIILAGVVVMGGIIVHEIAHIEKAKQYGYSNLKIRFSWKEGGFYINLPAAMSKKEKLSVLTTGVIFGFVFVAIAGLITVWTVYPGVLLFYYLGTLPDLKNMKRLRKAIKNGI